MKLSMKTAMAGPDGAVEVGGDPAWMTDAQKAELVEAGFAIEVEKAPEDTSAEGAEETGDQGGAPENAAHRASKRSAKK